MIAIKRHGGKFYQRERIIAAMPLHTHYVEPYFGGGSVLLGKPCEGISEVVNDLDRELTNFWRVLQNDYLFARFRRYIAAVPFSSLEYEAAQEPSDDVLTSGTRFFIRARQSRQGLEKCFATLSRNRTRRGMNEQAAAWLAAVDGLADVHRRLRRVVILCDDACKVIRQQDGPGSFFYLDPPYLHETRVLTAGYKHEMGGREHAILLATISKGPRPSWATREWFNQLTGEACYRSFRKAWRQPLAGKFLLSGYPSELYSRFAKEFDWYRSDVEIDNKASGRASKGRMIECLWSNYPTRKRYR